MVNAALDVAGGAAFGKLVIPSRDGLLKPILVPRIASGIPLFEPYF